MPDFENMSIDEIRDFKAGIKAEIDSLHDRAKEASEVEKVKIEEEHRIEARRSMQDWADRNGKTLDESIEYWMGRVDPTNGDSGRWKQALLLSGLPAKLPSILTS